MPAGERPELTVLGGVGARLGGSAVDLGPPGRRAVLARLAVARGAVVPTDQLVDDLWHGEPPPRALAGLQSHVSHLRRALEPRRAPREPATVLVSTAPGYALRVGDGLDAVRAADLARRARTQAPADAAATLRCALALWTGPVLAGFADETWARPEVERLDELRRVVVEDLAAAELERADGGAVAAALELLGPHVREHPLREDAVRLLALALYRAGRQADALAALADARRALADDLGLDPSPAVRDLEARILGHDRALLRAADPPAPAPPAASVPDPAAARTATSPAVPDEPVGRDPELARLAAAAERVAGAHGRGPGELVLLGGEAGVGKSTLAAAANTRLAAAGWRTVAGRCPEVDGAPPAWAWAEIAGELGTHRTGETAVGDGPGDGFHRGRALVAALRRGPTPVAIWLDDLHRADDETLRLLRLVVSAGVPGLLVLGTYRTDEVHDALVATFASLAAATGDRIELRGLDGAACADLLARLGVEVDADGAAGVADRTGGNPLFIREVARLAGTVGLAVARQRVPAGVRDVLRRRVGVLPAAAGAVLRRAAVLGRRVDVDVLVALEHEMGAPEVRAAEAGAAAAAAADGTDAEDRVLTALEAALMTGLVVEEGDAAVAFSHDLVRETLYEEVPRLRRARVHAAALAVLERLRPRDAAALARHALAAGRTAGPDRVLGHVGTAAAAARRAGSPQAAADLLEAALPLAEDPRTAPEQLVRVHGALASARAHAGATVPAVLHRRAAVAGARALRPGAPDLLFGAATCVDAPISFALTADGAVDRALLDAVADLLEADLPAGHRLRLLATRAFEHHPDEPDLCRADADAAAALIEPDAEGTVAIRDPLLRCLALNARFWSLLEPDRWSGLEAVGRALLDAGERAGSAGHRTVGHHARFLHACWRHDLAAASVHADTAVAESPDGQLAATLGWSAVFRAVAALVAGRLDDAEAGFRGVSQALEARTPTSPAGRVAPEVGGRLVEQHEGLGQRPAPVAGDPRVPARDGDLVGRDHGGGPEAVAQPDERVGVRAEDGEAGVVEVGTGGGGDGVADRVGHQVVAQDDTVRRREREARVDGGAEVGGEGQRAAVEHGGQRPQVDGRQHGEGLEPRACGRRQAGDLLLEHGAQPVRHPVHRGQGAVLVGLGGQDVEQRGRVQRVPARAPGDEVGQAGGGGAPEVDQARRHDPGDRVRPEDVEGHPHGLVGPGQLGVRRSPGRVSDGVGVAGGHQDHHPRRHAGAGEQGEDPERPRVGAVRVVEGE